MNELVLVVTDGTRQIAYNEILSFYTLRMASSEECLSTAELEVNTVVIDIGSDQKAFEKANSIRNLVPWMPILLVADFGKTMDNRCFSEIEGYGLTRVLRWRASFIDSMLDEVLGLLHPEYPSVKNDVAIVLPVYNEESRFNNVYNFVVKLRKLIDNSIANCCIYFINDGSHDRTQELVQKLVDQTRLDSNLIHNRPMVSGYSLSYNTRKAGTFIEALKTIDANIFILADADDSFEIEDIARMINLLQDGYYDLVAGTKDMTAENRAFSRRIVSFLKRMLTKPFLPKGIYDSQTGLKALRRTAAINILPHLHEETGLAIDLELMYVAKKMNFRVCQLPVKCTDREGTHVDVIKDSLRFIKIMMKLVSYHRMIK